MSEQSQSSFKEFHLMQYEFILRNIKRKFEFSIELYVLFCAHHIISHGIRKEKKKWTIFEIRNFQFLAQFRNNARTIKFPHAHK